MTREKALAAVQKKVKNANLIKHMLATEAILAALARRLGGDPDEWALAGLLHDIDVELTGGDMARHSKEGAELLRGMGLSQDIVQAVLTHNEAHGVPQVGLLDRALFCADPLTGLIAAVAMVRPDRISGMTAASVLKRFKEKRFAAGANREHISRCQEWLGLDLEEFVSLGVGAMQEIASDLGL
ncbi:MAG: HDIG domain-containing protein [Dehalococcoidia bacterium]|jgi:putative nucleotidyltransferase with HDIG domain|nr:HDIG domain-containing protein [Dehalococcoidia bacterium]MDP7240604.1 HDIG domain-containing protein [Dehalococcoidia bacterium]